MRSSTLVFCVLLVVSCGDDDSDLDDDHEGDPDAAPVDAGGAVDAAPDAASVRAVTLRFSPVVGSEPFACGASYAGLGVDETAVTPVDFKIYVHGVSLVSSVDGALVPVTLVQDGVWQYRDVALLDFEDASGACSDGTPETNSVLLGTVPAGEYSGVAFSIGVPEDLNHQDLTSLPSPLDLTSLWWGWNLGHLFLAIVTRHEVVEPVPGVNDHFFHLGSIDCEGDAAGGEAITCGRPNRPAFRFDGFDVDADRLAVDFAAPLVNSNLASAAGCHSFELEACSWPFDRVGLNWFTGSLTPTSQALLRVE